LIECKVMKDEFIIKFVKLLSRRRQQQSREQQQRESSKE